MLDLPENGLYRTTQPLPGHEPAVPAGVLVFLGDSQNGGGKFVVRPAQNRNNRWYWSDPTIQLRSPTWARTLNRLPAEGFYPLPDTLELSNGGKWLKNAWQLLNRPDDAREEALRDYHKRNELQDLELGPCEGRQEDAEVDRGSACGLDTDGAGLLTIPALQKDTRARNAHSSTAIEGNPLTLEQVAAASAAFDRLIPVVYDQLHRIALGLMRRERTDHTLQPTALLNELYVRLVKQQK